MPSAETDQNTPNPQGSGAEGGNDRKLYAGKYKTPEDMEKGYQELEKGFHGTRQELQELKELITIRLPDPAENSVNQGYGQSGREAYGQTNANDLNVKVLQAFYQDPVGVLAEVKEAAKREVVGELTKAQNVRSKAAEVVEAWKAENPDVVEYQDLLQVYVTRTDAKLPIRSRLDKAADAVRKRVLELREGRHSEGPGDTDHREAPSGGERRASAGGGGNKSQQQEDPEAEMKKYIAGRNAFRKPQRPGATP